MLISARRPRPSRPRGGNCAPSLRRRRLAGGYFRDRLRDRLRRCVGLRGGTETGNATDTAADTATDTATGAGPDCDGIELAQGGVLDLDIPAVQYVEISGTILLNGEPLEDAEDPRGAVRFDYTTSEGRPGSATHTLAATGGENYSVIVPVGEVDVYYVPNGTLCAAHPEGPMPCTGGVLIEGVPLVDSGVLDLDIRTIIASGSVTQDGGELPDASGERGQIEFVAGDSAGRSAGLGATGSGGYTIALFPGTYDVAFAGNPELCADGAAPVPCNRGLVASGLSLDVSGVLDLDVRRVEVGGAVTVGGAPMADGSDDRGSLLFEPTGGAGTSGGLSVPGFGAAGPVTYSTSVVAGSYTVALVANPGQCAGELPPTPCVGGPLLASVDLSSSGVLDLDIPRIDISGKVTLAGADLPDEAGERGTVVFTGAAGGSATVALASVGALDYALRLLPGAYTITFAANADLCDGETVPAMPCGGGSLKSLELKSSGVLDVEIPVVEISGKVTRAGAPLPDQVADRGSVVFVGDGGAAVPVALGTGPFDGYAITLMPGAYDVIYLSAAESCMDPADDVMPCGGGTLNSLDILSSGVLDVNIPAIELSGRITFADSPLPELGSPRGALSWTRAGAEGDGLTIDLGADGSKTYAVVIVPDRWVVHHIANPALCEENIPPFPCTDQPLLGCPAP